jgi:rare lipoprotein A
MFRTILCLSVALLASMPAHAQTMTASWYGGFFEGRRTSAGCVFHAGGLTAASRILPLGSVIAVSRGQRTVTLVVNDRGPYVRGRDLDLSRGAAARLGMLGVGVARVEVRVIGLSRPCAVRTARAQMD